MDWKNYNLDFCQKTYDFIMLNLCYNLQNYSNFPFWIHVAIDQIIWKNMSLKNNWWVSEKFMSLRKLSWVWENFHESQKKFMRLKSFFMRLARRHRGLILAIVVLSHTLGQHVLTKVAQRGKIDVFKQFWRQK